MVFHNETPNSGITLMRDKRDSVEWHIRYKLMQIIHPLNPNLLAFSRKKTHWVALRKPQGWFIKINSDGSKSSEGGATGFIIRNWEGKFIQHRDSS